MEKRLKIEFLIVTLFSYAIVILAPSILRFVGNELGRMIIKPLIYILLVAAPLTVSMAMKRPIGSLGYKSSNLLKQILTGFVIFSIIGFVFTIAVFLLGDNKRILLSYPHRNFYMILYYVIFDMFFVGIGEETLFRGYFLETLNNITNSNISAIVLSSLMFGIWHFPAGQDFLQVILTAIMGFIYATIVTKLKGCTTLSIGIAHGLHDIYILILTNMLL